ncbi:MAG: tyrosine-type recombinase/integrase [Candidatus Promineifilaceae bacterium]|nr:tyrosine-type recombinase/integrase [Candidatus Promineifilaceae bacterium]
MNEERKTPAAQRYDRALSRGHKLHPVPAGCPEPQPTDTWPEENIAFLERYRTWLEDGGVARAVIDQHRIPMAGHVLGLALKPHAELDLDLDLEKAMAYVLAKELSPAWYRNCRHSLNWFRRFLLSERGLQVVEFSSTFSNVERYKKGLPDWLVEQLEQYLHLRQANWRPSRMAVATCQFWSKYTRLWHWLYENLAIEELTDIKRRHLFGFMDEMLAQGYSPKSVNQFLYLFQAFLRFLQSRGSHVPQALLNVHGLKEPDSLPRFLTDEQVGKVREDLERRVEQAVTPARIRDSLLDRAAFYLLWHAGLRLGELEDLSREDLNLSQQRLIVRQGKGLMDRTVYLTGVAVKALEEYLAVRGPGKSDNVFIYRYRPLRKDLVRDRMKAAGMRTGVKVTPHMLRHTFGTQLVNAGCKITTIQALLGHRRLNSTMTYARVHDQTVAQDYFSAMAVIEERLDQHTLESPDQTAAANEPDGLLSQSGNGQLLALVDALETKELDADQSRLLRELRKEILALSG